MVYERMIVSCGQKCVFLKFPDEFLKLLTQRNLVALLLIFRWLPARAEPGLLSSLSTMSTAGASVTLGLRGCALSVRLCARVVGLRSAALVLRSPGLRSCAKDVTCGTSDFWP